MAWRRLCLRWLVSVGEDYAEVAASRGWEKSKRCIVSQMRAQNRDEPEIIQELIAVQVEAFRRAARLSANESGGL